MKKTFKSLLELDLQFFASSGEGEGYYISPEQLEDFDFGEPENELDSEVEVDESEELDSVEDEEVEPSEEAEEQLFEIDGEQYTLDQLREFKLGYMRQDDYTRKTQDIANRVRKEAEMIAQKQLEEYEKQYGVYKQLDELFLQNPMLEQQFVQLLQQNQYTGQAQQFSMAKSPEFQSLQKQLEEQKAFIEQMKEQQRDFQIQQEFNALFERYPEAREIGEIIAQTADQLAQKGKYVDLEMIYKNIAFDQIKTSTKKETQKEFVKNQMKRKKANTLKPNNQTGAKEKKYIPEGDGYESVVDYLLKQNINLQE